MTDKTYATSPTKIWCMVSETLLWITDRFQESPRIVAGLVDDHIPFVQHGNVLLAEGKKSGTMKSWMEAHDGQKIDTLQISLDEALVAPYRGWSPLGRRVDATRRKSGVWFQTAEIRRVDATQRKSGVWFHNDDVNPTSASFRDYSGCRVLLSNQNALLIADEYNAVLYVTSGAVS